MQACLLAEGLLLLSAHLKHCAHCNCCTADVLAEAFAFMFKLQQPWKERKEAVWGKKLGFKTDRESVRERENDNRLTGRQRE